MICLGELLAVTLAEGEDGEVDVEAAAEGLAVAAAVDHRRAEGLQVVALAANGEDEYPPLDAIEAEAVATDQQDPTRQNSNVSLPNANARKRRKRPRRQNAKSKPR